MPHSETFRRRQEAKLNESDAGRWQVAGAGKGQKRHAAKGRKSQVAGNQAHTGESNTRGRKHRLPDGSWYHERCVLSTGVAIDMNEFVLVESQCGRTMGVLEGGTIVYERFRPMKILSPHTFQAERIPSAVGQCHAAKCIPVLMWRGGGDTVVIVEDSRGGLAQV